MHAKGGSIFASPTVVILQQLIFSWSSSAIVIAVLGLVVSSWLSGMVGGTSSVISLFLSFWSILTSSCNAVRLSSHLFISPLSPFGHPKPWDSAVGRMQFGTGCTDAFGCFRMHGCRVLVGVGSAFQDMIAPRMHGCHWLARMRCQNPGTLRLGGCNLAPDARMLSDAFGCFRMHGCRVLVGVGSAFHDMIAPRMHGCHWLARMRCQNPGTLRLGGCNLAPDARMLSDAFGCTDVGYWLGWVQRFMTWSHLGCMVAIGWLGCVAKTLRLCGWADAIWHRMHGCFRMLSDARMSGTGWGGFSVSWHDRTSDAWLPLVGSDALPKPWDSAVGRMQFGTGCTDAFGCFRMLSDARMSGTGWGGFSVSWHDRTSDAWLPLVGSDALPSTLWVWRQWDSRLFCTSLRGILLIGIMHTCSSVVSTWTESTPKQQSKWSFNKSRTWNWPTLGKRRFHSLKPVASPISACISEIQFPTPFMLSRIFLGSTIPKTEPMARTTSMGWTNRKVKSLTCRRLPKIWFDPVVSAMTCWWLYPAIIVPAGIAIFEVMALAKVLIPDSKLELFDAWHMSWTTVWRTSQSFDRPESNHTWVPLTVSSIASFPKVKFQPFVHNDSWNCFQILALLHHVSV